MPSRDDLPADASLAASNGLAHARAAIPPDHTAAWITTGTAAVAVATAAFLVADQTHADLAADLRAGSAGR